MRSFSLKFTRNLDTCKTCFLNWLWLYISIILAHKRLRQENHYGYQACLSYRVSCCLKGNPLSIKKKTMICREEYLENVNNFQIYYQFNANLKTISVYFIKF